MEGIVSNLNGIQINIRKARITKVSFGFTDDKEPEIEMDIDLLTGSNKTVTSVSFRTNHWNENSKLPVNDIDLLVYNYIGDIINLLSPVAVRKINGIEKLLTSQ